MKSVLGIDLGTQSLKALAYDYRSSEVLACESAPIALDARADGTHEQDGRWWIEALESAVGAIDAEVRRQIAAIGVSGQQHGFVPLDEHNELIRPVKLWCDTATITECDSLTAALGGRGAWLEKVGNPVLPGYTISKILWLKNNEPANYQRLRTILLPHDYVNFYLTGERVMEYGDASGTGFLDVKSRTWSKEALGAIDPERDLSPCLPRLIGARERAGTLLPQIAHKLGLPAGIPVSSGGGDNMMGAIGTGNVSAGRLTLSLGTSATLYAYSDRPVIDLEKGEVAAFCSSSGGWLPLICSLNCANAKDIVEGLVGDDDFEARLARARPGSDGLLTVPFYNGERAPYLPHARGTLLGLSEENVTGENLLRSAIEGAMFTLKMGAKSMERLGMKINEIRVTGGGANSPAWAQIIADVFEKPVVVLENSQGAAFGAALQALWLLEGGKTLEEICRQHVDSALPRSYRPDGANRSVYRNRFEQFQQAVSVLKSFYH